jgi:hypothetical protein
MVMVSPATPGGRTRHRQQGPGQRGDSMPGTCVPGVWSSPQTATRGAWQGRA